MNIASVFVRRLISTLKINSFFENMDLVVAYENEIKPYPVERPIIAFSVDKQTIGERLIVVGTDGSETLSKTRTVELTLKINFFVPYGSGGQEAFRIADFLHTELLFNTNLDFVASRYNDCNYVRECGALVLETFITLRMDSDG